MVVTEENVRRLSRYAGISEEEARAALDTAGGDALEALALLERQGRIRLDTAAGRARSDPNAPDPRAAHPSAPSEPEPEREGRVRRWLTENRLECRRGARCFEVPMAALIALTLLAFWAVAALLLAGLCFGWRYRFAGPDLGKPRVNEVMDSIDGAAADARRYVRGKWDKYKKK